MSESIRPDLISVVPMSYPIVEYARFGSIALMCEKLAWPKKMVDDLRGPRCNRT